MPTWVWIVIVFVSFLVGFFAAALLASRSRDELLEEMDSQFKMAWKE